MANDYLSLFIADINRAFEGLMWSIEADPPALAQAGLHARDLADALGSVGLAQLSALTDDISRQLSLEQSSILPIAQNLVELLKKALFDLERSDDIVMLPAHVDEMHRLSADMLALLGGTSFQVPAMQSVLEEWANTSGTESTQMPQNESEGNPIDIQSDQISITGVTDSREYVPLSAVTSQRRVGLNLVQRIRQMLCAQNLPIHQSIDFLLSEHQDALSALGQISLAGAVYNLADEIIVDGVSADSAVIDSLVTSLSIFPRARRLVVNKQALTLFIDLYGVPFEQSQMDFAGEVIARAQGRIDQENDRLRITLPASLKRMRFLPFRRGSELYVVSWAQLVSIANLDNLFVASDIFGSASGCSKVLRINSGCTDEVLYADEVFPIVNMNSFLLPSVLSGPYWMKGVALDEASHPYSWVAI